MLSSICLIAYYRRGNAILRALSGERRAVSGKFADILMFLVKFLTLYKCSMLVLFLFLFSKSMTLKTPITVRAYSRACMDTDLGNEDYQIIQEFFMNTVLSFA